MNSQPAWLTCGRFAFGFVLLSLLAGGPHAAVAAERPTAAKLLPRDTLIYVRVADMADMRDRFSQTALGRIGRDPQIQPLVQQVYGSAIEAFREIEDRVGVSLDVLLSIPRGECFLALVDVPEGQPALVAVVDVDENLPAARLLLDRLDEALIEGGAQRSEEKAAGTRLAIYDMPDEREIVQGQRDQTVFLVSDRSVAKELLSRWDGKDLECLADNPDFSGMMKRCAGPQGETAQLSFYADPLALVSRLGRDNLGVQTMLALLPVLGLNGVEAIGGGITFATEQYDAITHLHLALDSPRQGIPAMLALESADVTPQAWVPTDVVSYTNLHWNFQKTYDELLPLYDGIRGEGRLAEDIQRRISGPLDLDFQKDLLDVLDGRITYVTWMVKPARLNSRANLIGITLKDRAAFQKTLDRIVAKYPNGFEEDSFAGVTYQRFRGPRERAREPRERPLMRQPEPCMAILGDELLVSDSQELLRQAILTKRNGAQGLGDQLEFRLVASKIQRLAGGERPALMTFQRPEEGMRLMYELATSETTRQRLAEGAQNNRFLKTWHDALNDNPLPPFAVIARYLAPGGSLVTNDASGVHYTNFTLRRK